MRPTGYNTVSLSGDIAAIGDTENHGSVMMRPVVIETAPGKEYSMTVEVLLLDETINDSNLVCGKHVYLNGYVCGKWRWNEDGKAEYQNLIYVTNVSDTPLATPTTAKPKKTRTATTAKQTKTRTATTAKQTKTRTATTAKQTKTRTAKRHRRVIYDGQIYDSITALAEEKNFSRKSLLTLIHNGWYKGRPLHYEGEEQKPMPKSKTNKGRRVIYDGQIYDSITSLAEAKNFPRKSLLRQCRNGWYWGKPIRYEGEEQKPKPKGKTNKGRRVIYDGTIYTSMPELAAALNIKIKSLYYALKIGWLKGKAVYYEGDEPQTKPKIKTNRGRRVIYDGTIYDSIKALAAAKNFPRKSLLDLIHTGWYKGKPIRYEGEEQKPMPKGQVNRGRRVIYDGKTYTSKSELAAALNSNIDCLYVSLKRGWYKGKAIHYEGDEPKPKKHIGRKSTIHIVYDGREYSSAKELAEAIGGTIGGIYTVRHRGSHTYLGKEIRLV